MAETDKLVVYLDEVGTPNMENTDPDFPVFALSLFVCGHTEYVQKICPAVNGLKFKWWGHESVILHSRDIRKAQGDFTFLRDAIKRSEFYADLNDVMGSARYQLLAVAIRKDQHAKRYRYPEDPYDLALLFALERLVSVLETAGQSEVTIVAEKRGTREDRELHNAFLRIVGAGSAYVSGERFRRIAFRLQFAAKAMNVVGTQIADLAAYPTARYVLDRTKPNPAFEIIRGKFCRDLKVFP